LTADEAGMNPERIRPAIRGAIFAIAKIEHLKGRKAAAAIRRSTLAANSAESRILDSRIGI